jgi:TrmH family RNA methyltransferase
MLSKNEIKGIQSLHHKKFREDERLFIAEGPKIIEELVQTVPTKFKKIYALKSWIDKVGVGLQNIPFEEINDVELSRLSQLQTPNEVVGVLHYFESIVPQPEGFILYLDAISDPGILAPSYE